MCDSRVRNRHGNGTFSGDISQSKTTVPVHAEAESEDVSCSESSSADDSENAGKSPRSLSAHRSHPRKRHRERRQSFPENGTSKASKASKASNGNNSLTDLLAGPRRVVADAEDFVRNVIAAGWRVVHHHHLPDWLQDNEHLVFGHRLPLNSFRACFQSVFRIHTETGNIWTHLLGMVAFISIAAYTLSSRYIDWMWQDITVHMAFFAGAILCLTFSWVFHTVYCHSEFVNKLFGKLDYCGIALLTVGSFVPWLYYGFYCHETAHLVYLVSIIILATACIIVSLFDRFAVPAFRPVRAGLFIALGLTGVVPGAHFAMIEGLYVAIFEYGLGYLLTQAVLYIGGALMYAFRIPESIYPGKFDIWFQSHQIFHICVILAALTHFRAIEIISHIRLNVTDCSTYST